MLSDIIYWWIYNNSIRNIKNEIACYSRYYYENFYRKITKPTKDVGIDLDRVENAIQRGVKWLESIQRNDGCIGGRLWEIWDTANATLALASTGNDSDSIERAVNFLLQTQLSDGGFFYEQFPPSRADIRNRRDLYCIETTPVALMAIYKYEGKITAEIKSGIHFLLEKQRECGGWELPYLGDLEIVNIKLNYFPSITGYALRAILCIDKNYPVPQLKRALNFVKETQHKDGSWGKSRCFYHNEGYAIRNMVCALSSVKTLKLSDDMKANVTKMLGSAISYTKRTQNSDGSWSAISIPSKSITTSLFLQSLLIASNNEKHSINLAVDWLLTNQEDEGLWKGGYYGHLTHPNLGYIDEVNNDVFATSEVIVALGEYKNLNQKL